MARSRGVGAFNSHVLGASALLILASLFLTAYSARSPRSTSVAASVFDSIFGPARGALSQSIISIDDFVSSYSELLSIREQHQELLARTRVLEAERDRSIELIQENGRLRKLLHAVESAEATPIVARVNGYRHAGWFHTISLAAGRRAGITPQSAVVNEQGVVGQVISVTEESARVLLLTDHTSSIDALVQSSRVRGVIEGVSEKALSLRFANALESLQVGDRVITSGFDGIFPPGLLIGRVSAIDSEDGALFQGVSVQPAANLRGLEEVVVLVRHQENPGESSSTSEAARKEPEGKNAPKAEKEKP